MTFRSAVKMTGELTVQKFNSNKELLEQIHVPNLVVTVGKAHIAERMISDTETKMSHMAIGSSLSAVADSNTALGTQLARVGLTSSLRTDSSVTYTASFGSGVGTGSITEAGIFNASSSGSMLCRTTFPVITKGSGETISISWTVTVG